MQLTHKARLLPKAGKLLSTRRGNLMVAAVTAVIAASILIVFLHRYRSTLTDTTPVKAVVANRLIPKGASANVIAGTNTLTVTSVRRNQLKQGAITNPALLRGEVAARDIFPGEQIVASDFVQSTQPVITDVQGSFRAVSIAVDSAHGLVGQVQTGDHVDVMASFTGLSSSGTQTGAFTRVLMRNILVLSAPKAQRTGVGSANTANQTQNVVLRVDDRQIEQLAFAADNGKVWLALRPKAGAVDDAVPSKVTIDRLLAGSRPLVLPAAKQKGTHR